MNKKELEAFAKQAAKSIKTEADLTDFRKMYKVGVPTFTVGLLIDVKSVLDVVAVRVRPPVP